MTTDPTCIPAGLRLSRAVEREFPQAIADWHCHYDEPNDNGTVLLWLSPADAERLSEILENR